MKTRKAATRKAPQTRRDPKNKAPTLSRQGERLDDTGRALIWTLTEEGRSQRQIAEQIGVTPGTVSKVLASDPVALEALRARLREVQSAGWKQIQALALDETLAWLGTLATVRKRFEKSGKRGASEGLYKAIASVPRALGAVRHAGEASTKMVQLLTGGATERVEQGGQTIDESNAEQLVQMAIEAGLVDKLPASMRKYAAGKAAPA